MRRRPLVFDPDNCPVAEMRCITTSKKVYDCPVAQMMFITTSNEEYSSSPVAEMNEVYYHQKPDTMQFQETFFPTLHDGERISPNPRTSIHCLYIYIYIYVQ